MRLLFGLLCLFAVPLTSAIADTTYPRDRVSDNARYHVVLEQPSAHIPLRKIHTWSVQFTRADGRETRPLRIEIDGGMPRHGHGLPTEPEITHYLGDGRYRIDGLLFSMPGLWHLQFRVFDETGWDQVLFKLAIRETVQQKSAQWTSSELGVIKGLMLPTNTVDNNVQDSGNAFMQDPEAAALGERLFFDKRLSPAGVACNACHQPDHFFADPRQESVGTETLRRNAPSLIGIADADWFYWDGRRDSLWSQALVPFEAADEMASSRVYVLQQVMRDPDYRAHYTEVFGQLPDSDHLQQLPTHASPIGDEAAQRAWQGIPRAMRNQVNRHFSNLGKAIAAYEGTLTHTPSRFDRYAKTLLEHGEDATDTLFSEDEREGLRWFISGRSQCLNCHNGPQFSNQGFHNIGTATDDNGELDYGRSLGIRNVLLNEFNCESRYVDRQQPACKKLQYINATEISGMLAGAFKVPGLRNVAATAPYMHDGRFKDLSAVMSHYRNPPGKTSRNDGHELSPLNRLDDKAIEQLIAFLKTLDSEPAPPTDTAPPAHHHDHTQHAHLHAHH